MFKNSFPKCSRSWYYLFTSPIETASCLNFCSLAVPVCLVSWYVFPIGKSLFAGRLRIVLIFTIFTIAPPISESLLSNTPINDNSPKVSVHPFTFLHLILMFVVSHVNLLHIHVSTYPKMITDVVLINGSAALKRTVRFVAIVDVVLEEYNSRLPNKNDWVLNHLNQWVNLWNVDSWKTLFKVS